MFSMIHGLKLNNKKFDVILVAGQSNAQGNGKGNDELRYKGNDRAFEINTRHPVGYIAIKGVDGSFIYPFIRMEKDDLYFGKLNEDFHDDDFHGGFYLSFADEYVKKYLNKGRDLLIIKAGSGGSGFSEKNWFPGGGSYEKMIEMINIVLNLNKDNRFVAFLWHQGECDIMHNTNVLDYKKYFLDLYKNVVNLIGNVPLITGDFSKDWALAKENKKSSLAYSKMFRMLVNDIPNYGFVETDGLESNAKAIGTDDTIHFSRKGQLELGLRYFEKYNEILSNKKSFL